MKKLILKKEVLRQLDVEEVQTVVGGLENSRQVCKASTRAAVCPEPKPKPQSQECPLSDGYPCTEFPTEK